MFFKRKSNVIYRNYDSFGYITDNRNFGYKLADDDGNDIGDKIISQSGSIFFSVLDEKPQTLDCLAQKIKMKFENVDIEIIKNDAMEFYSLLESEGFVASGLTAKECDEKDFAFSYKNAKINNNSNCSAINNFKKSTQEFFDEYFNSKPQLTNLHIEITSKCNERCIHCYIPHENKTECIDSALMYNILEQCRKMNVLHITISGGEPLLHDEFINFLRKCKEYNFSVNVLSNLTLLNEDILDEMKKNHLLSVQTSLYAMDANIHDAITQVKGSFEKTKNAILTLVENNIPLQISCPIMKQNIDYYKDVMSFGAKLNVKVGSDYVIIAKYNNTTQNLDNRLSIEDVGKIINQQLVNDPYYIESLQKEIENKKEMNPDDFVCSICYSSICIAETGNVYPCAGWQGCVVGNINKNSLNEIWTKSPKVQYLRNLRKRDFPKCIKCTDKEFCTMCMVRNANEHPLGDPLEVNDYFCRIAKINKKIFLDQKYNLRN
ncbi:MAG: radical SAM protein [Oscillospiraceae bacterium]|nr:radical SAM protein [Oscillospiraceae bacterium]